MGLTKRPKNDIIFSAKIYLNNAATDSYIASQLAYRGFVSSRLEEGCTLQEKAWSSRQKQLLAMNKAKGLYNDFKTAFNAQKKIFKDEIMIFRCTFFRDEVAKEKLGLNGKKKRDMKGYIEEARVFYSAFEKEPGLLKKLEKFNFTATTVKERLEGLKLVERAYFTFFNAQKEAKIATAENNRDIRDLQDWLRVFQAVCRSVLSDKPQYLEKVGLTLRRKPSKEISQVTAVSIEDDSSIERKTENAMTRLTGMSHQVRHEISEPVREVVLMREDQDTSQQAGCNANNDSTCDMKIESDEKCGNAGRELLFNWLVFFCFAYISYWVTVKNQEIKGKRNKGRGFKDIIRRR